MSHHEEHDEHHHEEGGNHGCEPASTCSVKGPGMTAHDPTEPCDTHDADGNGDDLCPVPTKPQPVPTTTTTQPAKPTPVTTLPARPVETTTAVVQPVQPAGPQLAVTGAGTDALVFVAISAVAIGHRLVKMTSKKREIAR